MALFPFSSIERSLQQGARANAASAVQQNRRHAELRRQAAHAQAQAQSQQTPAYLRAAAGGR